MSPEIARVAGRVDFFLGLRFQRRLNRRVLGSWRFAWIGLFLVIVILTATFMGAGLLSSNDDLVKVVGWACYLAAMAGCVSGFNRFATGKFRQKWRERGTPDEIELLIVVAGDGLHVSSETGKSVIPWPYLSEVCLAGDYWLVIGPGWGLPLSRSFFATQAEEGAFLSAVLERITPAARARSPAATRAVLQA